VRTQRNPGAVEETGRIQRLLLMSCATWEKLGRKEKQGDDQLQREETNQELGVA